MFFNENLLFLEGLEGNKPEMSNEEIKDTLDECYYCGLPKMNEAADFEIVGLMVENKLNESYYNLREKMMNIEHIASLKRAKGLYSESEMILQEGFDEFVNNIKKFLDKVIKFIKNLFNRLVEFITGLFVSVKDIAATNNKQASEYWKNFKDRYNGRKIMINMYSIGESRNGDTFKPEDAENAINVTKFFKQGIEAIEHFKTVDGTFCNQMITAYKALKNNNFIAGTDGIRKETDTEAENRMRENYLDKYKTTMSKIIANDEMFEYLLGAIGSENKMTLGKAEVEFTEPMFKNCITFIQTYKTSLREAQKAKDEFTKALERRISEIEDYDKDSLSDIQRKLKSDVISTMRFSGSKIQTAYDHFCGLLTKVFTESVTICKRVIGVSKAKNAQDKLERMTEGFDYRSYFNDAFVI